MKYITNSFDTDERNGIDLIIYHCGHSKCAPNHCWGPGIRDHYLFHYILNGKGSYRNKFGEYNLNAGNGFIVFPNEKVYYKADKDKPWEYVWIGLQGLQVRDYLSKAGYTKKNPIFYYDKDDYFKTVFFNIIESVKEDYISDPKTKGFVYLFLSKLMEISSKKLESEIPSEKNYVSKAVQYIHKNYYKKITINELSDHVGLNRSYFSTIFKQHLDVSPKQFLDSYRISKACYLIENSSLNISEIANAVGYQDIYHFSKVFKKYRTHSPRNYIKNYLNYRNS